MKNFIYIFYLNIMLGSSFFFLSVLDGVCVLVNLRISRHWGVAPLKCVSQTPFALVCLSHNKE